MRVRILGSGSPRPSAKRANSSYLVEIGDDRILLDHGFGAGQRLVELGMAPQSISHLFLSHHHYDHMGEAARLILTRWDQQRTPGPELEIFGPPPVGRIIDRLIGRDGAFATDLTARIESRCSRDLYAVRGGVGERAWPVPLVAELEPGDRIERAGWTATCALAVHCPGHLACLAYRIDAGGRSLVYSGDTGPSEPITELARGCDLLIHMCSQTSGEIATESIAESCIGHLEVAESAARAGVGTLVLTHIEHLDDPAMRRRVLADIAAVYDGEVVVAEDLMAFELGALEPAPAGPART